MIMLSNLFPIKREFPDVILNKVDILQVMTFSSDSFLAMKRGLKLETIEFLKLPKHYIFKLAQAQQVVAKLHKLKLKYNKIK